MMRTFFSWFKKQWISKPLFSTMLALLLMVILQTCALGFNFPSVSEWLNAFAINWTNVLRNNATVGIVALGMTFVIITGGIDLAVGSTLAISGAAFILLLDQSDKGLLAMAGLTGWPAFAVAVLLVMLFGALLGSFNGILIANSNIPAFIVTLGTMKIFRSVTQYFMQARTPVFPNTFVPFANFHMGNFMILPIIYWLLIAAFLYFISSKTIFGSHVIAVGSNEKAARLAGINVKAVKRWVYILSGALVSFAAVIQISRIGSMDYSNAGNGYEMDAIAAVIVGGTRMSGGRGSIIGTVLGMLIIGVMNNLLNLVGVPPFLREAFKGVIVIGAVLLQRKEAAA